MVVTTVLVVFTALSLCIWLSFRTNIPSDIAWAGGTSKWPHDKLWAYVRSIWDSHTLLQQGYDQFSRHGKAFVFANLFTGAEVLLPLSYMDWLHDQPETMISSFEAHREFMRADWTFLHPTIFHEHVFERVIKMQLTRQLDELTPALADESKFVVDSLAAGKMSFELVHHADWKAVVLQTVSRIYVGQPLCRDKEYLDPAGTFNDLSMLVAALISMIPPFLRPLLAPLLCLRDRWLHSKCAAKTKPVILDRIKQMQNSGADSLPHDLISWAIVDAYNSEHSEKRTLDFLAARISMMNFVSIDSTSITIENVLYDILANAQDGPRTSTQAALIDELRAEIRAAHQKYHDHTTRWKSIINSLPLLDACLKESFRLNNFISRTNVRKVVAPEGIQVPGVGRIPQGTVLAVSLWGAHHDETAYPEPGKWRMSRWLDNCDKEKASVFGKGSAKTLDQYLPFGYRRHACPGRFFALRIVKLIIANLLLEFDVEMTIKDRPWNPWLGVSRGPPLGSSIKFTRRQ